MAQSRRQVDSNPSFLGGMNEGIDSSLLSTNQTVRNINVTLRDGNISPRPRLRNVSPTNISQERPTLGSASYEDLYRKGRTQHVGKFQTALGEFLILVQSGVIFAVDVDACSIRPIELDANTKFLNYKCRRLNGHQGDNFYIIYDSFNQPVVIDQDLTARRTDRSALEIPPADLGTFVHGRNFVASGTEFIASDFIGNTAADGTDPEVAGLNPPLTFYDSFPDSNLNPSPPYAESSSFRVSYVERTSPITAMGHFQATNGNTGLGFGPLFISTKESIHLFPVNQLRSSWTQGQFGTVQVFNYGIIGPRAHVNVGGDLYYRSCDCHIYSLKGIFSDQQSGRYRHISKDIECSLVTQNKHLAKYAVMGYFDNRIFTTLRPFLIPAIDLFGNCVEEVVFNGLGVLELNPVNSNSGNSEDVWASLYTGHYVDMVEVNNEYYFVTKDKDTGCTEILKLEEQGCWDSLQGLSKPVKSRVYTRQYDHGAPFNNKLLVYLQPYFKNVKPPFSARVFYRTDTKCDWVCMGTISIDCSGGICDTSDEMLCPTEGGNCYKYIQFRIDICGVDYDFTRQFIISDIDTEIQPERELDDELPECFCEDFSNKGDLCL